MSTIHDIPSLRAHLIRQERNRRERRRLLRGIIWGVIISAGMWAALAFGIAHAEEPAVSCIPDAELSAQVDANAATYLAQYPGDPLFQGYAADLTAGPPSEAATDAAYVYAPEGSPAFTQAAQALGVCVNADSGPLQPILSVSAPLAVQSANHGQIELKGHRKGKGSCPRCGHHAKAA